MTKNFFLMLATAGLMIFTAATGFAQGAMRGPRVAREDYTVIFKENGKEIKRTRESDLDSARLLGETENKVMKKLGVSTLDELDKKNLNDKFYEERNKFIEREAIVPPVLNFYDDTGKVVKTIELTGDDNKVNEIIKKHPKLGRNALIKETVRRNGIAARNGTYAMIIEDITEQLVPETEEEKKSLAGTDADYLSTASTIKFYDANGNVLWEDIIPQNMVINEPKISDDGEVIAMQQNYVMGGQSRGVAPHRLVVLNKDKKELLVYPKIDDEYSAIDGSLVMSPNGRYISASGRNMKGYFTKFYFDLKNGTVWEAPDEYYASRIEDNGSAYIDRYLRKENRRLQKVIDLKEYLGK